MAQVVKMYRDINGEIHDSLKKANAADARQAIVHYFRRKDYSEGDAMAFAGSLIDPSLQMLVLDFIKRHKMAVEEQEKTGGNDA